MNFDLIILIIISGLKNDIMSEEKTKIGSRIQIGEVDSITNCLTTEKLH
jgi:hypothetical protein